MRRISRKYPPHYEKENSLKVVRYKECKNGSQLKRVFYICNTCKKEFTKKEIRRDHIEPVIPPTGFPKLPNGEDDWNIFIKRLFNSSDGIQLICTECHNLKTNKENKSRKKLAKKQKKR